MIDAPSSAHSASSNATRELKSSSDQQRTSLYSIPPHPAERSTSKPPARPSISERRGVITSPITDLDENAVRQCEPSRPKPAVRETSLPSGHPLRKSPKTFRKTVSDPTALRSSDGNRAISRPSVSKQPESKDEEKGPWTSEALDLFDWWPPGRPKPC